MTNRDENREFYEAVRRVQAILGRKLRRDEIQRLHREITDLGLDLEGIVETGLSMFG